MRVRSPDGEDNPYHTYLLNDDWAVRNGVLQYDAVTDTFELHVRCRSVVGTASGTGTPEHETVLGVDLNVDGYVAVTSTGRFVESADSVNHVREQYERRRGSLQKTDTQSAHRALHRIGHHFSRWSEDLLHRIANAIIEEAIEHDCTHIAVEDLTHIRERTGRDKKFQQWMFRRLRRYVAYKAVEQGIEAVDIDPNTPVNGARSVGRPERRTETATSSAVSTVGTSCTRTTTPRRTSG